MAGTGWRPLTRREICRGPGRIPGGKKSQTQIRVTEGEAAQESKEARRGQRQLGGRGYRAQA